MLSRLFGFLKEVQQEAKKVSWPSRQETVRNTIIVIGFSVGVAALLGAFDFVFNTLLRRFIL